MFIFPAFNDCLSPNLMADCVVLPGGIAVSILSICVLLYPRLFHAALTSATLTFDDAFRVANRRDAAEFFLPAGVAAVVAAVVAAGVATVVAAVVGFIAATAAFCFAIRICSGV